MNVPVFIITLGLASARRTFQEAQAIRQGFVPNWQPALGIDDFSDEVFLQHAFSWQRPLKKTEVGCFLSHLQLWQRIAVGNGPAVVLEDDALLSEHWYPDIVALAEVENADYICLETWNKKVLGKQQNLGGLQLRRLHLNSAGAAGYMLWPSGAKILIDRYKEKGAGLADAFINEVYHWRAWQLIPANVVQIMVAPEFGLDPPMRTESFIAREQTASPTTPNIWVAVKTRFRRAKCELRKAGVRLACAVFAVRTRVSFKARSMQTLVPGASE
ncbi:MAG: glycosyltransferase family 25 protein [Burkholderiaceae bacterium]